MQDLSASITSTSELLHDVDRAPPSSAADPKTAPSPRFQNYYSFGAQPYRNPNHANGPCIRPVVAILVSLILVISAPLLVIWLIRNPRFPEVRVRSFSVTNLATSPRSITGTWHVGLVFLDANNKMTASYSHVYSSILYKSESLTETSISPFKEGQGAELSVQLTFSSVSFYVDEWVVESINEDIARGKAMFDVKFLAKIAFTEGGWRTRTKWLRVYCSDLPVEFSGNRTAGVMVGGAVHCQA